VFIVFCLILLRSYYTFATKENSFMVNLYLVRHGETEENVARVLQGHSPGTLTPAGREQAAALCETLRPLRFDAFFASDLRRAVHTAEILRASVGRPFVLEPLLRERDWGELTGRRIADVQMMEFPPGVESVERMSGRAARFIARLLERHQGGNVLAVTHGLFARCLQAAYEGTIIRHVPRLQNAEVRLIRLEHPVLFGRTVGESGAAAD